MPSSATPLQTLGTSGGATAGLLNLFSGRVNLNVGGWSTSVSGIAALSALLLGTLLASVWPVLLS